MSFYSEDIKGVDRKDFPLLKLLPIGLLILDAIRYKFNRGYDKSLLYKLSELYGRENSLKYLRVFWANQILVVLMVVPITILLLVGGGIKEPSGEAIFILFLAPVLAVYGLNAELDKKVKLRRRQLSMDFCDFLSIMILLINAGMNIFSVWERIALDQSRSGIFHNELKRAYSEIVGGKSETEAYEDFAQRCKIPEISKFIALLLQNIKKGNDEMVMALRQQVNESWNLRKGLAKTLGEEASTKLLLPMMLMFGGILLIVITPAILILSTM